MFDTMMRQVLSVCLHEVEVEIKTCLSFRSLVHSKHVRGVLITIKQAYVNGLTSALTMPCGAAMKVSKPIGVLAAPG